MPWTNFKSFSGPNSPELDEKLKPYQKKTGIVGMILGAFQDSLVIKNGRDTLESVTLANEKVRGVVCSENRSPPGKGDSGALEAKCLDTYIEMKGNARVG